MKVIPRFALLFFAAGSICGRAHADGKFYGEGIPPDIPYQRGFILFHEGSETLVLQGKYESSPVVDVNTLGWIVPVPSVPEIASADADAAHIFFFKTSWVTQPKLHRISVYVGLITSIFFCVSLGFLLFVIVEYPFLNKIGLSRSAWRRRLGNGLTAFTVAFLLVAVTMPHLGVSSGAEVVKAEKAGIYDVKVVRSQSAEGILGWLKENGFSFDDVDVRVFENYVSRNWCFIVAKVDPEPGTEERKIVAGKMVAPLILRFETDRAIYPLALTSTVGTQTEVLLYTLCERKLTCGERLTLRHATKTNQWKFSDLVGGAETQAAALFADVLKSAILCKFKKRLKPEEMKEDIVFEFAPDDSPYRETKIVW